MRHEERERLESWRTELWLAAWLVRNGVGLTLEPTVGKKRPEFVTATSPQTWWEVKSPLDLEPQRQESEVLTDVQQRLREIPEPFVLHVVDVHLRPADVANAVRDIRAQIREFAQANSEPPAIFESNGLIIQAVARAKKRTTGFLGTMATEGHVFEDEHPEQVYSKIASAVPQLPEDGAGIVVIDLTVSDWIDETDVVDACYGLDRTVFQGDKIFSIRVNGFFRAGAGTRVSAVVYFSRHPMHWDKGYEMTVLHNPYAKVPLPEHFFQFANVKHKRRVEIEPRHFQIETTGDVTNDS